MSIFLETKRLVLKAPALSDLDNLIALRTDPDVMKYIGTSAIQKKDEIEIFLKLAIQYYKKHGFGFCSVFEKESGIFIGQAGLFHLGFDETQPKIEVAYRLHKNFWGKGYGTELAKALIQWGFQHLSIKKLIVVVDPENIRSQQVLKKAGLICTGKVKYYEKEVFCYEIYKNDSIELVPYDTQWPEMAELEIKTLKESISKNHILDIQHVGSTAIPGMQAKPIIDIQIAVDSLTAIKQIAIATLKKLGYEYWYENPDPERMFFVKGMPPFGEKRSHHVHIVEPGSRYWREKIIFRDYLLYHLGVAREYETLKLKLAQQHTYDREQYTDAKTKFVNDVLQKARKAFDTVKQSPFIVFLTGVSGAGKTTLLNVLSNELSATEVACLHFDSIGVPPEEEMINIFGSGSEWQKAMTYHWVKNLITNYKDKKLVIFEGQVNLDFIVSAFEGFDFHQYKIILAHCENEFRHKRLYQYRNQPELINEKMDKFASFLKKQAIDKQVTILNTTSMNIDEMVTWFLTELSRNRSGFKIHNE